MHKYKFEKHIGNELIIDKKDFESNPSAKDFAKKILNNSRDVDKVIVTRISPKSIHRAIIERL